MADSSFGNISSVSVSQNSDDSEYRNKLDSVISDTDITQDNQTIVRFESPEESKIEGASNSISMRVFPKSAIYQQPQSKLRRALILGCFDKKAEIIQSMKSGGQNIEDQRSDVSGEIFEDAPSGSGFVNKRNDHQISNLDPKSMSNGNGSSCQIRQKLADVASTESILQNFCQYCFHAFAKPKILQKHQRQFHYIVDGEVKRFCAICSKSFIKICYKNEEEFLEHAASRHGIRIQKDESGQIIDVVGVESVLKRRPYKKRIKTSNADQQSEKKAKNGGKVSKATTKSPEKSARQSNVESHDQIRVKMEIEDEEKDSFQQSSETGTSAWRAIVKAECTDLDMDDAVNIKEEPSDDHFDA